MPDADRRRVRFDFDDFTDNGRVITHVDMECHSVDVEGGALRIVDGDATVLLPMHYIRGRVVIEPARAPDATPTARLVQFPGGSHA